MVTLLTTIKYKLLLKNSQPFFGAIVNITFTTETNFNGSLCTFSPCCIHRFYLVFGVILICGCDFDLQATMLLQLLL